MLDFTARNKLRAPICTHLRNYQSLPPVGGHTVAMYVGTGGSTYKL